MKSAWSFPVVGIILLIGKCIGAPPPQVASPKKVTTTVTYAYEQGDEPIPEVSVPSGTFNTPQITGEDIQSASEPQIERLPPNTNEHPITSQQLIDLARDLQPPPPVPAGVALSPSSLSPYDIPVAGFPGPIPLPFEQQHPPHLQINLPLEEINTIRGKDEQHDTKEAIATTGSKIFPAKTHSFTIFKAPMIQEHSVTNDGDFMKALAHAFGVTNRFAFNSPTIGEALLKVPEYETRVPIETVVSTEAPPILLDQIQSLQQQQNQQSLQEALIQSLQRMPASSAVNTLTAPAGNVQPFFTNHNIRETPTSKTPKIHYSVLVADGDSENANGQQQQQVLGVQQQQEEVKVPLAVPQPADIEAQPPPPVYSAEVFEPPLAIAQQPEQPHLQLQQFQQPNVIHVPKPHPVLRKFFPQKLQQQQQVYNVAESVSAPSNTNIEYSSGQIFQPIDAPKKFSDSTLVSRTTFSRARPQNLFRNPQNDKKEDGFTLPITAPANFVYLPQQIVENPSNVVQPGNALSGEIQKEAVPQQRYVYRHNTNADTTGAAQFPQEETKSSESEYGNSDELGDTNSQEEIAGKYALFEPQRVLTHGLNGAGPAAVVIGEDEFRRRRPNGRRLKVRRKKVKRPIERFVEQ